jgi:hypothetical protein
MPLVGILIIWAIVHLIRFPGTDSILLLLLAIAVAITGFKARSYALKVQDRVIRLEERLRLAGLLPDPLRARIPELTESQLIALRFASDAEMPSLVERTLNEKLMPKRIKDAIQQWRGDYWRV